MKHRGFLVGLFVLGLSTPVAAQCPAVDFALPLSICHDERVFPVADHPGEMYEWDFCSGDLDNNPAAEAVVQLSNVAGRPGLELVEKGRVWYGFVTGTWANSLQCMEFGNGLEREPTSIFDFGNLSGALNGPGQVRMILQDQTWHALIHNTTTKEILKVTFGSEFSDVVSVNVLTAGVGYLNSGLAVEHDPVHGWVGVISEPDNTISVIRFGNDLHPSGPGDVLVTPFAPNANNLGDVDLINICGKWFGAAVNFGSGNTYLLDFGDDLFSIPQIDEMATLPISNGARLRFAKEGMDYFLLVASLDGIWHKLEFGTALHLSPQVINEGNMGGRLPLNIYAVAAVKENSTWNILTVSQANGAVFRINYPQHCTASQDYATDAAPEILYEAEGTYTVSLNLLSGGVWQTKSKSVVVSGDRAPDIEFVSDNICAANDVSFSPLNVSGDIAEYHWDFGDLSVSNDSHPVHQYTSASDYHVGLEVISDNGCTNRVSRDIHIYPKPESSFTAPEELLCTNNEFRFLNSTNDIYDGNLSYQWFVDDNPVSTDRDLKQSFATTGPKAIRLVATIPGCADEMTLITPAVQIGPVVDFSFDGICEDETFSFQHHVAGPVESYFWHFGDDTSMEPNPLRQFPAFGQYNVSLTATNAIGCENKKTKTVTVYPKPLVDFNIAGPPNACSDAPAHFQNQTTNPDGGEITEWLWHFNDAHDPTPKNSRDAEHVFQTAGTYSVSLTANTVAGCASSTHRDILIHQSPSTSFTHSSACDDVPVLFSPPADGNITDVYWEIGTSYYEESEPTHTFRSPGDYPLYLKVTAANGCEATASKTVHVPPRPDFDFSVSKNCVNQAAVFTDITTGVDPVEFAEWTVNGTETFTGSSLIYTFTKQGPQNVRLKVTTKAGCAYEISRQVPLYDAPVASFSPDKDGGAYPLEVKFTNTSTGATHFRWEFLDGTGATSNDTSPQYTFSEEGTFDVVLTAYNDQQCEDSISASIATIAPLPNAEIELITLAANSDGSTKLILTIHNKGNTVLQNVPVDVDFSGNLSLRQMLEGPVLPGMRHNFVLNTGIVTIETLQYLCAAINVDNDLSPAGNRMCRKFGDQMIVFASYPNPTSSSLNLEWISGMATPVRISLADAVGRTVRQYLPHPLTGLNRLSMDLGGLQSGLYYLLIEEGNKITRQRIVVSR